MKFLHGKALFIWVRVIWMRGCIQYRTILQTSDIKIDFFCNYYDIVFSSVFFFRRSYFIIEIIKIIFGTSATDFYRLVVLQKSIVISCCT